MINSESNQKEISTDSNDSSTFITVLFSTFSTIFLAELGDKTQIATLMLSAQSGRPFIIFIGAALALISTSLLGVIIGRWIANNLPRQRFTFGAGLIMIIIGLCFAFQGTYDYLQNLRLN